MRSFHAMELLWALSSWTQGGEGCLGGGRRKERVFQSFPRETVPHPYWSQPEQWLLNFSRLRSLVLDPQRTLLCTAEKSNQDSVQWLALIYVRVSSKRYTSAGEGRMGDLRLSCEPHSFFPSLNQWLMGWRCWIFQKQKGGKENINLSLKRLYDNVTDTRNHHNMKTRNWFWVEKPFQWKLLSISNPLASAQPRE